MLDKVCKNSLDFYNSAISQQKIPQNIPLSSQIPPPPPPFMLHLPIDLRWLQTLLRCWRRCWRCGWLGGETRKNAAADDDANWAFILWLPRWRRRHWERFERAALLLKRRRGRGRATYGRRNTRTAAAWGRAAALAASQHIGSGRGRSSSTSSHSTCCCCCRHLWAQRGNFGFHIAIICFNCWLIAGDFMHNGIPFIRGMRFAW